MPQREHAMLGPGGRVVHPKSESALLLEVINILDDYELRSQLTVKYAARLGTAERLLQKLYDQVSQGYHRNPYTPFRVIGRIGKDVHFVAYQHAKDGKYYQHDFKGGNAEVIAVERHGKRELLITSPSGEPLWDEF